MGFDSGGRRTSPTGEVISGGMGGGNLFPSGGRAPTQYWRPHASLHHSLTPGSSAAEHLQISAPVQYSDRRRI